MVSARGLGRAAGVKRAFPLVWRSRGEDGRTTPAHITQFHVTGSMRLVADLQTPGSAEARLQLKLHIACPNSEAKAAQARGSGRRARFHIPPSEGSADRHGARSRHRPPARAAEGSISSAWR